MTSLNRIALLPPPFVVVVVVVAVATFLTGCSNDSRHASSSAEHIIVTSGHERWHAGPPALPPGGEAAVLEGDPTKSGPFTMRARLPDGYRVPPHWHSQAERITVLSGTFFIASGDHDDGAAVAEPLTAGSYTSMPARMHHFAWVKGVTVIQISGNGPFDIHYLNPKDDPRNSGKK